jgi:hypothetical protein
MNEVGEAEGKEPNANLNHPRNSIPLYPFGPKKRPIRERLIVNQVGSVVPHVVPPMLKMGPKAAYAR